MEAGRFRPDLYYRINGLTLVLPALRERSDFSALVARLIGEPAGFVRLDDRPSGQIGGRKYVGSSSAPRNQPQHPIPATQARQIATTCQFVRRLTPSPNCAAPLIEADQPRMTGTDPKRPVDLVSSGRSTFEITSLRGFRADTVELLVMLSG